MTNTKRTEKMEPAAGPTGTALVKFESEVPTIGDDAAWEAHDRAIAERREDEEGRARSLALRERGKRLIARGAPEALVDLITSGRVDKTAVVMDDLDQWNQSGRRIVVLSGPVGVGKTVGALRWLANFGGLQPCFVRAGDFEARGRYSHVWRDAWQKATGMILDDMGAEYQDAKGNLLADLDTLIDTYAVGRGRLIITTNLTWEDFQNRYEERISSRIVGNAAWVNVTGRDQRRI